MSFLTLVTTVTHPQDDLTYSMFKSARCSVSQVSWKSSCFYIDVVYCANEDGEFYVEATRTKTRGAREDRHARAGGRQSCVPEYTPER